MVNKKFWLGMLVMVLAFGMTVVGCEDDTASKTIDSKLIGKWEWNKILVNGTPNNLPYENITSGGYVFTSSSFTSYLNGSVAASAQGVYTENNTLYTQNGQAGYTYSITGNTLTANDADGSGVIANKVSKFSWE